MFSKALIVLAVAAQALATVFVTAPVATTTWTGGQSVVISWIEGPGAPSLADFGAARITVSTGNALEQTHLQIVSESIDVSAEGQIAFDLDASIGPVSDEYFIRIESLALMDEEAPQYPALSFSSKFQLNGMTGEFTAEALEQIAGQSTAPIASAASTGTPSSSSSRVMTTTSRSTSASASESAEAAAEEEDGALAHTAGFAALVASALLGLAML